MRLPRLLERWAAPDTRDQLVKRQRITQTPVINIPLPTLTPTVATTNTPDTTANDASTTQQQQATNTPTTTPQNTQTTAAQQTTNRSTTNAPSSTQPASTNRASTTAPASTNNPAPVTITSRSTAAPTDTAAATNTFDSISASSSSTAAANKDSGSFGGSRNIATGVGVVAGVVGGFAVILLAVFMWRRHQRRKQMERIGSMEELPRAPSPGPLSRSFTRGHGARQPIDDDDDDFLTPMDTLPNTVRLDEWNSSKSSPTGSETMYDDKSVYAESVYQEEQHYDNAQIDDYPMPPPAAMTATNDRYYSGDFSSIPMQSPSTPSSSSAAASGGAIPTYSAMNKYAAYSAGATASSNTSTQRPGGGYRAHDSFDAGGYV